MLLHLVLLPPSLNLLLAYHIVPVAVGTTTQPNATQGLGAATLNEFKRTHKKALTENAATAATAAAAAAAAVVEAAEDAPSVTARLDLLLEKKRDAVLGPSKISTAESRGAREYQASQDKIIAVRCSRSVD